MSISPPSEHLDLGQRVRYHHRACVARAKRQDYATHAYWIACGEGRHGWDNRLHPRGKCDYLSFDPFRPGLLDHPRNPPVPRFGVNKTIMIWPEEGEGIIIGLVRRGIGESVPASGGDGLFNDSWEPGYFTPYQWVWLYAIKTHLNGLDMVLAPMCAVSPVENCITNE